jgi:hypothetical protein
VRKTATTTTTTRPPKRGCEKGAVFRGDDAAQARQTLVSLTKAKEGSRSDRLPGATTVPLSLSHCANISHHILAGLRPSAACLLDFDRHSALIGHTPVPIDLLWRVDDPYGCDLPLWEADPLVSLSNVIADDGLGWVLRSPPFGLLVTPIMVHTLKNHRLTNVGPDGALDDVYVIQPGGPL